MTWNVNIADRFELEKQNLQSMTRSQKREKAKVLVHDLIQMNATIRHVINEEHHAKPGRTPPPPGFSSQPAMAEAAILKRIVAALTNEPHEVERLNQIDRGWPAAVPLGGGTIQIQRFKASTDTGNQKFLWSTFQALIHEYTHTLAHAYYNAYADGFGRSSMEWNTLIEGVNSLLTEIVWSSVNIAKLRPKVEGARLAALPLDPSLIPIVRHRYPSYKAAMRLVNADGDTLRRQAEGAGMLGQGRASYRMMAVEHYAEPIRVWHVDGNILLLDVRYPVISPDLRDLLESLGKPEAMLDSHFSSIVMEKSEWVYASKGLSLFINPDNFILLRLAAYQPASLEHYHENLRLQLEIRRRPGFF